MPLFLIVWSFAIQVLGIMLIVSYIYFAYRLLNTKDESATSIVVQKKGIVGLAKEFSVLLLGIAGVIVSSFFIVDSGLSLSESISVSETVIGAIIIAVGTSLPKLAISLSPALTRHGGLALGNAVGGGFTNITILFGLLLMLAPGNIRASDFLTQIVFSLLLNLFLWYFLLTKRLVQERQFR